jgi:hypothetical protein
MHLRITGDTNEESGVGRVIDDISGPTRKRFLQASYGDALLGIVIVLMCRDPQLNFKQRIRRSTKEKKLYIDIMLSLDQMRPLDHQERGRVIAERLLAEVPPIIAKYRLPDFDLPAFTRDFQEVISEQLLRH